MKDCCHYNRAKMEKESKPKKKRSSLFDKAMKKYGRGREEKK
jgi:hypothetical protein